jgi:hypothetical protein
MFLIVLCFYLSRLPGCLRHLASEKKQIKGLRPGVYRYHKVESQPRASELISSIERSVSVRTVLRARSTGTHV